MDEKATISRRAVGKHIIVRLPIAVSYTHLTLPTIA